MCQDEVEETGIRTAVRTAHSAIHVVISFNSLDEMMCGPSYWKFNSSLIEGEDYISTINEKIQEWLVEFKEVTDKRVLWDLIKYHVRQFTMKYSKEKAKKRKQQLVEIETSLKEAEEALTIDPSTLNFQNLENF